MQKTKSQTILETIKAGFPLTHIPVLDFHSHMGSSSRFYYVPYNDFESVNSYLDRYGVDHMLTFALSTTTDPEVKNNAIYQWTTRFPERFSSLTTLHAGYPQDWIELLKQGEAQATKGIKLLSDYQGVDELTVDWSPAFDYAKKRKWIVLHHDWRDENHLFEYARAYPELTFLIGHPTLRFKEQQTIVSKCDNVYQSTCAAFVTPGFSLFSIEDMYHSLPLEKILFGSDALDLDLGTAIGPIAYANIPEPAKEKILGYNALELAKKLDWDIKHIESLYVD